MPPTAAHMLAEALSLAPQAMLIPILISLSSTAAVLALRVSTSLHAVAEKRGARGQTTRPHS